MDFRIIPHLSDVFSEEGRNPLSETHHITAAPVAKLGPLLPTSADSEPSDGRGLNFRMAPRLSDSFSAEGIDPLSKTHRITAAPVGKLRRILSESVDFWLFQTVGV